MSIRTIWSPYNEWGTEGPPYVVYPLTPTPQDIQSKGRFRVPSIYAVSMFLQSMLSLLNVRHIRVPSIYA